MSRNLKVGLGVLIYLVSRGLVSETMDSDTAKALQDAQSVLNNPALRNSAIQTSPDAKGTDAALRQLTGDPVQTQRVYELSSKILGNLVGQTGGNADKMNKILEQAKQNPAAFADTFTSEQKKELNEIAAKISPKTP